MILENMQTLLNFLSTNSQVSKTDIPQISSEATMSLETEEKGFTENFSFKQLLGKKNLENQKGSSVETVSKQSLSFASDDNSSGLEAIQNQDAELASKAIIGSNQEALEETPLNGVKQSKAFVQDINIKTAIKGDDLGKELPLNIAKQTEQRLQNQNSHNLALAEGISVLAEETPVKESINPDNELSNVFKDDSSSSHGSHLINTHSVLSVGEQKHLNKLQVKLNSLNQGISDTNQPVSLDLKSIDKESLTTKTILSKEGDNNAKNIVDSAKQTTITGLNANTDSEQNKTLQPVEINKSINADEKIASLDKDDNSKTLFSKEKSVDLTIDKTLNKNAINDKNLDSQQSNNKEVANQSKAIIDNATLDNKTLDNHLPNQEQKIKPINRSLSDNANINKANQSNFMEDKAANSLSQESAIKKSTVQHSNRDSMLDKTQLDKSQLDKSQLDKLDFDKQFTKSDLSKNALDKGLLDKPAVNSSNFRESLIASLDSQAARTTQINDATVSTTISKLSGLQVRDATQNSLQDSAVRLTSSSDINEGLKLKQDFGSNLAHRIQWIYSKSLPNAQIMMDPAELGPMNVKVQHNQGETSIIFQVSHPATRDALNESLPRLKEMLEQQGINLSDASVEDHSGHANPSQTDDNQEKSGLSHHSSTEARDTDNLEDHEVQQAISSHHILDLYG
jgi:flagellar hook-length control protein FliK